jgi:hypothetical protein
VLECFPVALKSDNPELPTILAYAEFLNKIGKTGKAIKYSHGIIINRSNIPGIWIHGATLLLCYEELKSIAAGWISEAKMHHPKNIQVEALANQVTNQSNSSD